MVDTQRSKAELLTIFADGQAAGSITPQNMRDLVTSMVNSHGAMAITSTAATTIGTPDTYVKAAGGTGVPAGEDNLNFSHPISNKLVYSGRTPVHSYISGSVSISAAGANKQVGIKVAKNGVVIDDSMVLRDIGPSGDVAAMSFHIGLSLETDDFVELFVTNTTDTTSLTVEAMYFHVDGEIE